MVGRKAGQAFGGGGNAAGAMGEGFGDYLAAVNQNESDGPDPEWTPCIMEWDATSYDDNSTDPPGICLRRADDPDSRTEQIDECGGAFDIHCVGQVWSSALLDLRNELGDDGGGDNVMDTLVLGSHFLLPPSPNVIGRGRPSRGAMSPSCAALASSPTRRTPSASLVRNLAPILPPITMSCSLPSSFVGSLSPPMNSSVASSSPTASSYGS